MLLRILIAFFILLNTFVALNKKRSKPLIVVTALFIVLLFVGSRDVLDLPMYHEFYNHGFDKFGSGGQYLFQGFTIWCHNIGLSFDIYRLIISVVGVSLYVIFINRHSPLPNMAIAAYMCYLMFMDDVQIRNFIACAVFCMALSSLLLHQKNWRLTFFIWILVAATIHTAFWVYLIFLFIPNNTNKDKIITIIGIAALAFSIFVLFFRDYLYNVAMFFAFLDEEKTDRYAVESNNFGSALFIIIQFFAITSVFFLKKYFVKGEMFVFNKQRVDQTLQIIYLVNVLSMVLVPAAIFSITFYRLVRNIFLLNAVAYSVGFYYSKKPYRILSLLMLVFYTGMYCYYDLDMDVNIEGVLEPFFNKNIFFSF